MRPAKYIRKSLLLFSITSFLWLDGARVAAATDAPKFDFDTVNLAADDLSMSRFDLYIKIKNDNLQFIKGENDGFNAQYEVEIVLTDEFGLQADKKGWVTKVSTQQYEQTNSSNHFTLSLRSFELPPGKYDFTLQLQDSETGKSNQKEGSIVLRDYSLQDDISTSDILYLDRMVIDADGKLQIRPKVSGERYEGAELYAYFEVYNVAASDSVHVVYEIVDEAENVAYLNDYWLKGKGRVLKNCIDIKEENLLHGHYMTRIKLACNGQNSVLERSFKWSVSGMPDFITDIDEAIEVLKYLASSKDLKRLKKSENKYKEFVAFWQAYDPIPETSENELRDAYYHRIEISNAKFSTSSRQGWKTDRGWALVKLGEPSEVTREPYVQGSLGISFSRLPKAVEIWSYYQYNQQLWFVDEDGFGDYRLVNPEALYDIVQKGKG
jgi:GWxTD domain-containing protein